MKLHDLTESKNMLGSFKKDIQMINNHQEQYFHNVFSGEIDILNQDNFNKVKEWRIFYALEDRSFYETELSIVLKNEKEYAVINYYNAGVNVGKFMQVFITNNKEELKKFFKKTFIFNRFNGRIDNQLYPRFDFDNLIDIFPEVNLLTIK